MVCLLTFSLTYLFDGGGYIDHIVAADDQRAELLHRAAHFFFCLVQYQIHVHVVSLQDAPDLSSTLEADNDRLTIQNLI